MEIAAAVGAERLREIMAELVDRAQRRFSVTAARWTSSPATVMAVFGAPVASDDHAVRACLAALVLQEKAKRLAVEVHERDGVDCGCGWA